MIDDSPNPSGLCQCGCGQPAPIATRTTKARGRIKGQPVKFIRGHNSVGMNRSKPLKATRYVEEDRGYKTPCWIWQLSQTSANSRSSGGYGKTRADGKDVLAHRWYYEQAKGPIPEGMQVDHLCSVRLCVNPDHLEAVSPLINTRRSRTMKISYEDAVEIYRRRQAGEPSDKIATAYPVSSETVWLIGLNGPDAPRLATRWAPGRSSRQRT